ncbi:MAG: DUF3105 domain-containing protein [Anaerolineae bacterium]|nr:DUF3105 domain-containing protein [Anaerolineae bacterium]
MSRKNRLQRKEKQQKQSQNQRMILIGGVAALVLFIGVIAWVVRQQSPLSDVDVDSIADESVVYANLGQEHIGVDDAHAPYNSNPPTSGPHAGGVRTDFYTQQLADENLIHNLEHGHIWLSYRDSDDSEAIDLLQSIQSQFLSSVVVTYRPENDTRIAVAAWNRLLALEEVDEDQILAFISRYRDKAPESVPER